MVKATSNDQRDRRVLELYDKVLEIEQRLIPTGLHVFGRAADKSEIADLLSMVAAFDRPELGVSSLPDLVAAGLGVPAYKVLLNESANSEERLHQRESVESVVRDVIERFVDDPSDAGREAAINLGITEHGL